MGTEAGTVKMEPMEVKFSAAVGGFRFSHHKLTPAAGTKDKLGLKVKCSDNRTYRLRPVYSYLEPGKELTLTIARLQAPDKKDKLVIHVAKVPGDAPADPAAFWKGRKGPPDSTVSMALHLGAGEAPTGSVAAPAPTTAYKDPPPEPPKDPKPNDKPADPKDKDKPADAKEKDKPADPKDKDKPADAKDKAA